MGEKENILKTKEIFSQDYSPEKENTPSLNQTTPIKNKSYKISNINLYNFQNTDINNFKFDKTEPNQNYPFE